jgi:hypothetical protein
MNYAYATLSGNEKRVTLLKRKANLMVSTEDIIIIVENLFILLQETKRMVVY